MVRGLGLRVFLASAVALVAITAALVSLGFQVAKLRSEIRAEHRSARVLAAATGLDELQDEMVAAVDAYLISHHASSLRAWRSARQAYPAAAARLVAQASGEPQESAARTLAAALQTYDLSTAAPVMALARRHPAAARALAARLERLPGPAALPAEFDAFLDATNERAQSSADRANHAASLILMFFAIRIGGSLLVIIGIVVFLQRRILLPIRRVSLAAQRLASGELAPRVPVSGGSDEISGLARSFNAMAGAIEHQRNEHDVQNRDLERLATVLRAVLDSTIDGILLTDLDGNVQLANRPLLRFAFELGLPREGTATERLLAIKDKLRDEERYVETMHRLAAHPEIPSADEIELADSHRVFVCYTAPVRDDAELLIGRIWTLRDLTLERQLDRLKEEFVATVSHELRTPLTSMMGFLEMLREGEAGTLTPEQDRFLAIVYRSSERLQRLVGDLLFVARLDASGIQLQKTDVRLDDLVAEAVEASSALARAGEIDLTSEPSPAKGITLHADRERLRQLVGNLISNALKFTPAGGRVVVRAFRAGEQVVVEVEDTGIGIPEAEQERVFERFYRSSLATAQAIPGTGLGLVISRAIVEAHGGQISVSSRAGELTCFRVELPFERQFGNDVLSTGSEPVLSGE